MKIQAFGYDPEADELDLLIDTDTPQPAESVPVDGGVYLRRDVDSGRVVGAIIRGYADFLHAMLAEQEIPAVEATKAGLEKESTAILEWQWKALRLSRDLLAHLEAIRITRICYAWRYGDKESEGTETAASKGEQSDGGLSGL